MQEFSQEFLRCVRCGSRLDLEILKKSTEIEEGILECSSCDLFFPIIKKIPILWDDFSNYISERISLGGKLFNLVSHTKLKKFLKNTITNSARNKIDRTFIEEKWAKIYQNSKRSKFYSFLKKELNDISNSQLVLEHGCSIGLMSEILAKNHQQVFGIDRSFSAISIAKKTQKNNLDYFVSDSLSLIFGKTNFDLILALNVLEIIEPNEFIRHISEQISHGNLVISDPYDFERGSVSVKHKLDELSLRAALEEHGFSISLKTKKPSFIPWNLKINSRTTLRYNVDLVVGKKN